MFLWMKDATIIKACWFYMPCLNVFFNMLFAFLFCEHRCQTSSLNVLDATSVAGTQARLRRTWKRIKNLSQNLVDAEVGSKACQVRKQAEAQNSKLNWNPLWKPCNWNFENQPFANRLLLQIPSARDRPANLVGRNNSHLIPALLWLLHGWPILILTRNHRNFESLTSNTSNRWNQTSLSWIKNVSRS